jgi:ribose 1,5-bisphosphokinase
VGPSGAGKDTLLARARARFEGDPLVVFPPRLVTRMTSAAEDHITLSEHDFAEAVANGGLAFWWEAHGLKYALPIGLDDHIRAGRTVVCNVSRGIIRALRQRYARLAVVLITAPPDILAARLAARGRASDGDLALRIARQAPPDEELAPDLVIENIDDIERSAASLLAAIRGSGRFLRETAG